MSLPPSLILAQARSPSDQPAPGAARPPPVDGVLLVDKPKGPTSHDVVQQVRRALGTRAVGHAGTLDPEATGLLVVAVGEGTKLVAYLTGHDKRYEAVVEFGRSTTTLDAQGVTVEEAALPAALQRELDILAGQILAGQAEPVTSRAGSTEGAANPAPRTENSTGGLEEPTAELNRAVFGTVGPLLATALAAELARTEQTPPAFSAIKVDGRPAHRRARRGEAIALAPRSVSLRSLRVVGATGNTLRLELVTSKGYFVRAFARDLGVALGVPAHLASLRRTASGPFDLSQACVLGTANTHPAAEGARLRASIIPLARAATTALGSATLTEAGTERASQGKALESSHFSGGEAPARLSAWLAPDGRLVAIGQPGSEGRFVVRRGFTSTSLGAGG